MFMRAAEATLYAKPEVTYATLVAPAVAADVLRVFDLELKALEADTQEDEVAQTSWGNSELFHVGEHVSLSFKMYLVGPGAGNSGDEPAWALPYRCCGNAVTLTVDTDATYNHISVDGESMTVYVNIGANRHPITGWRGSVTTKFDAKKRCYLEFKGMGLFNVAAVKSTINPDVSDIVYPLTVGEDYTSVTLHGVTVNMVSFSYDQGNDIKFIEVTGYKGIDVDDRKPKAEIVIMAPPVATQNWFTVALAGTAGPLIIDHGAAAGDGKHIRIEQQRVQLVKPEYTKVDGKWGLKMGLHPLPGEDTAGNDEHLLIAS